MKFYCLRYNVLSSKRNLHQIKQCCTNAEQLLRKTVLVFRKDGRLDSTLSYLSGLKCILSNQLYLIEWSVPW